MQNEIIKVNDEFILHSSDGNNYKIVIYNVNYYRPPDMTFAVLIYDEDGRIKNPYDDFFFIGEDFFIKNKEEIERI